MLKTYLHQIKEGRRLDRERTLAKLEAAFQGDLAYTEFARQEQAEAEFSTVPV